ncbi:hypothetical protein OVY29_13020 [Sphingopyxis sp. SE2]|uniref:hypothetical protein n=1 Tax=Sphingopyxis sp. SE2 TaxID=1586240 RepID=UPI0028C32D4E|nr:hypothetical protein [Sphingopyxis sp. SE2]MDT7529582.1 hypothetical protein [Sphingopyxis sp. SE2]
MSIVKLAADRAIAVRANAEVVRASRIRDAIYGIVGIEAVDRRAMRSTPALPKARSSEMQRALELAGHAKRLIGVSL